MKDFPHIYKAKSEGEVTGSLTASANDLPNIVVTPPIQFGGRGDAWSPEELFMASIANCLVLSFRAIASASKLEWKSIECVSEGTLDKVERKIQFTHVLSRIKLHIPTTESKAKAEKLLHKADEACFVSNSISCASGIECKILLSDE